MNYDIISPQTKIHEDCLAIAHKHRDTVWQTPIPDHQKQIMDKINGMLPPIPLLLDSGCGTGMITDILAKQHPACIVLGIDKSAYRLAKHTRYKNTLSQISDNTWLVRAELFHLWRLLLGSDFNIKQHTLFYPNPWPKTIKRRFHGHPIAKTLFALCDNIVLRSNWQVYAEEFAYVAKAAYKRHASVRPIKITNAISLFEQKYVYAKSPCWEVTVSA